MPSLLSGCDLYVILHRRRDPGEFLESLLGRGVRWFQYRDKESDDAAVAQLLKELYSICESCGAKLIVNDLVEMAARGLAHGVHLGRDDMPVAEARRVLGKGKIVGRTVRGVDEGLEAQASGADYLGVGAIYPTGTKPEVPVVGVGRLREVAEGVDIPVIAVGGITLPRIGEVLAAGASGIAVASAVLDSPDPGASAEKLLEGIRLWRLSEQAG